MFFSIDIGSPLSLLCGRGPLRICDLSWRDVNNPLPLPPVDSIEMGKGSEEGGIVHAPRNNGGHIGITRRLVRRCRYIAPSTSFKELTYLCVQIASEHGEFASRDCPRWRLNGPSRPWSGIWKVHGDSLLRLLTKCQSKEAKSGRPGRDCSTSTGLVRK